jgi:hypothetical protein
MQQWLQREMQHHHAIASSCSEVLMHGNSAIVTKRTFLTEILGHDMFFVWLASDTIYRGTTSRLRDSDYTVFMCAGFMLKLDTTPNGSRYEIKWPATVNCKYIFSEEVLEASNKLLESDYLDHESAFTRVGRSGSGFKVCHPVLMTRGDYVTMSENDNVAPVIDSAEPIVSEDLKTKIVAEVPIIDQARPIVASEDVKTEEVPRANPIEVPVDRSPKKRKRQPAGIDVDDAQVFIHRINEYFKANSPHFPDK